MCKKLEFTQEELDALYEAQGDGQLPDEVLTQLAGGAELEEGELIKRCCRECGQEFEVRYIPGRLVPNLCPHCALTLLNKPRPWPYPFPPGPRA